MLAALGSSEGRCCAPWAAVGWRLQRQAAPDETAQVAAPISSASAHGWPCSCLVGVSLLVREFRQDTYVPSMRNPQALLPKYRLEAPTRHHLPTPLLPHPTDANQDSESWLTTTAAIASTITTHPTPEQAP